MQLLSNQGAMPCDITTEGDGSDAWRTFSFTTDSTAQARDPVTIETPV